MARGVTSGKVDQNVATVNAKDVANCVHYWIITTREGPESPAQCKHCGEERKFPNTLERAYIIRPTYGRSLPDLEDSWTSD